MMRSAVWFSQELGRLLPVIIKFYSIFPITNKLSNSLHHLASLLIYSYHAEKAGADIKEMSTLTFIGNYKKNFIGDWTGITNIRKPIIAAVNGYAVSYLI